MVRLLSVYNVVVTFEAIGVLDSPPALVPRCTLYEVAPVDAVQLNDTEALPAVAVRLVGAAGTVPAPDELELLLDELELDDEEELELDELDEEELELDDELDEEELLEPFGMASNRALAGRV